MNKPANHLHPITGQMLSRSERELHNGHRGLVVWMTGLSGSGKSTLALALERRLFAEEKQVVLLDGDNIRTGINQDLSFSEEDRQENIRRIAEVARLFVESGHVVISSFISPTRSIRGMAKAIIGEDDFLEVFIDASLEICESRDVKGLYQKARAGEIKGFTGVHEVYEPPDQPDVRIDTATSDISESLEQLYDAVILRIS